MLSSALLLGLLVFLFPSLGQATLLLSPMLQYTFTQQQACRKGIFNNTAGGLFPLLLKTNQTECDPSMGIQSRGGASGLASNQTNGDWLTSLKQQNALSLELWFQPSSSSIQHQPQKRPILTLGQKGNDHHHGGGFTSCDQEAFDFQLSQTEHGLQMEYRTSNRFAEPCQVVTLDNSAPLQAELTHLVVVLVDGHQQVFVNGQQAGIVLSEPMNFAHWHDDWHMLLLGYEYPAPAFWEGSMFQLSLFSGAMSELDVQQQIRRGLPPSVPYALKTRVQVNEDAEAVAGSHPSEWYLQDAPIADTARIALPYGSLNKDVEALQQKLGLTPSNAGTGVPPVYYYITKVPARGHLVQTDGTMVDGVHIDSSGGVLLVTSPTGELIFIPPLHTHSKMDPDEQQEGFTRFWFCVSNVPILTINQQQCQPRPVTIDVLPVNDPPTATSVAPITQIEGNRTIALTKIRLSGQDVDIGDSISKVEITSYPRYGDLILSVTNFRKDLLLHGTPLPSLNYTVSLEQDPVFVNYVFRTTPEESPVVPNNMMVKDSFRFRVQDKAGLWSLEETVTVHVMSAVSTSFQAPIAASIREDDETQRNVKIHAQDDSGYRRRIGIFIEEVPPQDLGSAFQPMSNIPIEPGSLLEAHDDYPYTRGISLTLTPSKDFCSRRNSREVDDDMRIPLRYRAVAFAPGSETRIASVSDSQVIYIRVQCSMDDLTVSVPKGTHTILESTLRTAARTTSVSCRSSSIYNATPPTTEGTACNRSLLIHGIEIHSRDQELQTAVVTILPGNGFITLSAGAWGRAILAASGGGGRRALASKSVTFRAFPEDLTEILHNLQFQSFTPGADSIEILIRYGNCSSAGMIDGTQEQELSFSSLSPSCQFIRKSIAITVEVDALEFAAGKRLGGVFPWQILLCLLGYPFIYFIVVSVEVVIIEEDEPEDSTTIATDIVDDLLPKWIQHRSPNGMFYYENTENDTVTWMAPIGEQYRPWVDPEES